MDFDYLREQRSALVRAVIVIDNSTDLIKAIWRLASSQARICGQYAPSARHGLG